MSNQGSNVGLYLRQHQLINHNQHGFLSRHSTSTQLLETINDLYNHHAVDAVFFDFAKAFDSVSHTKLMHKLAAHGIAGDLFNCLADFVYIIVISGLCNLTVFLALNVSQVASLGAF